MKTKKEKSTGKTKVEKIKKTVKQEYSESNPKILPATNDFVFKHIFGDARYPEILEDFLKSVLDLPVEEYESITF